MTVNVMTIWTVSMVTTVDYFHCNQYRLFSDKDSNHQIYQFRWLDWFSVTGLEQNSLFNWENEVSRRWHLGKFVPHCIDWFSKPCSFKSNCIQRIKKITMITFVYLKSRWFAKSSLVIQRWCRYVLKSTGFLCQIDVIKT